MTERMNECVQAGTWGLDDTGLEYMPNRDVAEHIQQKALKMYIILLLLATVSLNHEQKIVIAKDKTKQWPSGL